MSEKQIDVYGIGNALVDIVVNVSEDFLEDHEIEKSLMTLVDEEKQGKILSNLPDNSLSMKCGGSAANTIIAISQFGGKSFYTYKVANDNEGIFYVNDLIDNGVGSALSANAIPFSGVTGKCLVMTTPDAERTMNTFLGITSEFSKSSISEDTVANSKFVYIEGYLVSNPTSQEAMVEAIKLARKNNTKVALTFSDPSMVKYFNTQMKEVVAHKVDLLFCNEEEALLFTEANSLSEAITQLKEVTKELVITRGAQGATIVSESEGEIQVEAVATKAIDTNGAGDMFAGAFLYGITNGLTYEESGKLACKAASEVVSTIGPRLEKEKAVALV